jgi:hypothetical protein
VISVIVSVVLVSVANLQLTDILRPMIDKEGHGLSVFGTS